ncbi:S8 family serine peptidase [Cytobacillus sp. FJAT-54145]|uniref:S8 family serine peptidase n=1 Tax=Cytobacillus spartinae TaxID=3299023 RepID=A0ABW6KG99_9BACI
MSKKWLKKSCAIVAGVGLFTSSFISPASAQINIKDTPAVSAIKVTQKDLQERLDQTKRSAVSEDTLVIRYKRPLSTSQHRQAGGSILQQFSDLNYVVVKVNGKEKLNNIIEKYKKFDQVVSVHPSVFYKPLSLEDPKAKDQYQNSLLQLEKAQKLAGNHSVTVAVVDQGVDMDHPDLKNRLLPSFNTVNPMNQGTPDYHGTHVAGIVAANKGNGIGGYGVNPNAKILPIDVFDRGWGATDYAIAQGILLAVEKGANIINMSLGGPMKSPLIEAAIDNALEKNVVVIASAGNTGDDSLSYPAAYEGVISVGAVNSEKKLASFSTYGTSVDVVAPGEEIYAPIYEYEKKSSFQKMSGTSMSAPMVSGLASLLLSKYPNLTPLQVEYILEHTAEDLGDKGFDTTFGNGMIDPIKALQFNINDLPELTTKEWNKEEIFSRAEKISLEKELSIKGSVTKPFEEKWYKTEVTKGENIQFVLDGAEQFDFKLLLHLSSPDGEVELDLNKVREGAKEGKLFEVPFTGELAVGVKEVNGSYDDSARNLSKYELSVSKVSELPKDESSIEAPISIDLPYDKKEATLIGEDGDDDFYRFSVEEEQVVKIDLSGLPGVDTSIGVYMGDQFALPEDMPEEERKVMLEEFFEGEYPMDPMYHANKAGKSEGESLVFTAMPGMEYYIRISNKMLGYFGMYDFIMNFGLMDEEQVPESSLETYKLEVVGKSIGEDEDMFPYFLEEKFTEETQLEKQMESMAKGVQEEEVDFTQLLKDGALPYEIGSVGTGSLQRFEDEDWFGVTPTETGIYEFSLLNKNSTNPMMEIYQIREDELTGRNYLEHIGSNVSYNWIDVNLSDSLYTGLKKDKTYYIKFNTNYYTGDISFEPYEFTSKLIVKDPQDKQEDDDDLENIKNLVGSVVEGNFSMPHDQDISYFESKSTQVYGVTLEQQEVDLSWKSKYPKELVNSFYGMIMIVEDVNKNRKLDEREFNKIQVIDKAQSFGLTYGSFKAEKNKNYILLTTAFVDGPVPLSLLPYKLTVAPVQQNDEDAKSVVTGNVPSKPLTLKKVNNKKLEATGYLNAGVPYGDEDWFELKIDKDSKGKITLNTGVEVDGIITLYKNGKELTTADYYAAGDNEVLYFNLKKGTYHFKVRDMFGHTTLKAYKIQVDFN